MFLFDSEASATAGVIKKAVFAEINSLGLNSFVGADWYDFLADVDPAHVRRCRFAATRSIEASWAERLRITYRLFLGRTPETVRVAQEPQEFPELMTGIVGSEEFLSIRSCVRFLRGPAFNARRKLIFLHVPRTGGTYFSAVLRRMAPLKTASCYDLGEPSWMLDAAFAGIFHAHFSRSTYRADAGHLFVSIVRSPAERFASRARYYEISLMEASSIPPMLLDEAVEGFQTRFIFGDRKDLCFPSADPNTVVIPLERLDEVAQMFGRSGNFEGALTTFFRNTSAGDRGIEVPPTLRASVNYNDDDELYRHATATFDLTATCDRLKSFLSKDTAPPEGSGARRSV